MTPWCTSNRVTSLVQQATNHAWINRGTQPCRILFVLVDSKQP